MKQETQTQVKELRMTVSGRVQGVSFRYTVKQKALKEALAGFVENNSDGTVTILAQGPVEKLEAFEQWILSSPGFADVRETKRKLTNISTAHNEFKVQRERNIFKDQMQSFTNLGRSLK